MRSCVLLLVVAALAFGMPHLSSATDIFGYFFSDTNPETREEEDDSITTCDCDGVNCNCCVDFNLTYIDLGGPGCVQMTYLPQDKAVKLNISYGQSLLNSQEVKGPNPNATCMALLTNVAEICARFSSLLPYNDGLRGCLLLEPKLLKAVTATFKIGCFTMDSDKMLLEEGNVTYSDTDSAETVTEISSNQNETQIMEGDLLTVVNETAEKGLVFLGQLFGLAFGESPEADSETSETATETTDSQSETSTST